jgi:beta-glucosidase
MTLEEKLGQLVQYNPSGSMSATVAAGQNADAAINPEAHYKLDIMQLAKDGRLGSMLNVNNVARSAEYQHAAIDSSRLHIPILFGSDILHGYRTIYPVPLGLAATFDPALVTRLSHMAAEEATTSGVRWFYAPMVDVSRDARWGRVVEGAGEDTYLGEAMARAYIEGYQGKSLSDPTSVAASVKHFAAYGAAEAGREYNTTDMSESRLRQVYLPPYKAAVDAGAATVMSAFNSLNGVPASGNPYLLDTILRKQWGFDGFVVSDYTSVMELMHHGTAVDAASATKQALEAGVDVDMMAHLYDAELPALIKSGRVSMATVDEAVRRVLRVKFALGLFENPYPAQPEVTAAVPEHRTLAREAAEESLVLLQNRGSVLPLSAGTKVALIGPLADAQDQMQGSWSIAYRKADNITLKTAFEEHAAASGGAIYYAQGTQILSNFDAGFAAAEEAARKADVVVMALGESVQMNGEATARTRLDLPGNQAALLERIAALGKPVVLVVFSGRPLVLTAATKQAAAIVETWFPGTEAGHAVARVLYGDVTPSGKLPMSFPYDVGQEPLYYNQLPTGRPANDADLSKPPGSDSKYISRYIDAPNAGLFPFGYGLSYTTFAYSDVAVSKAAVPLKEAHEAAKPLLIATATVKNTGSRAATEIVQCYVRNRGASLEQPVRSLEGFARVTLAPGESKQVSFPLGFNELSFFDNSGKQIIEATDYTVWIGGDSLASGEAHFLITH